ncbi:hypothetical protein [Ensifer adhaerens]|uniref:hypothetical protein n=1 Tax=Ensifer adhaerens TaxID=106592 RepID=UPI001C4E1144|nr:hypothetical protein [Ensifer adhaerens]MBW0367811.1 hypothetical protein [Ensifer adhaerens]UCM24582.1 hypothetical protein LDL63_33320 [Ensifer adhaerens]
MGLVHLGRARLAMALPRHRERLRSVKDHGLYDLFEKYALAAKTLDVLQQEAPRREERIHDFQQLCLDLQAEVVAVLDRLHEESW